LNAQNVAIESQIAVNNAVSQKLNAQITDATARMEQQKTTLAANLKQMYLDSGVTPLEMIASSNNLSDYFNQQQYQDSIKNKIQSSLETIQQLKSQLESQEQQVSALLADQRNQAAQVQANQAEVAQLAAVANQSAAAADQQVQQANSQAASLRSQQAAILAARLASSGGGGHLVASATCGGGYPDKWCQAGQDTVIDNWGMFNRECVSYTAYKVAASGRNMPYWGGNGNAKQWPSNARAAGISVTTTPRVGDVAISYAGTYGHAMYVEGVSGGNITVSQYNFSNNGQYSMMTVPATFADAFIHF
jgi:surface antigen